MCSLQGGALQTQIFSLKEDMYTHFFPLPAHVALLERQSHTEGRLVNPASSGNPWSASFTTGKKGGEKKGLRDPPPLPLLSINSLFFSPFCRVFHIPWFLVCQCTSHGEKSLHILPNWWIPCPENVFFSHQDAWYLLKRDFFLTIQDFPGVFFSNIAHCSDSGEGEQWEISPCSQRTLWIFITFFIWLFQPCTFFLAFFFAPSCRTII